MPRFTPSPARVALVGTYAPRRCGLAAFAGDLVRAVTEAGHVEPGETPFGVFALNDPGNSYEYGPEVRFEIAQEQARDYLDAAQAINAGPYDLVSVQHEYGIYGGEQGRLLLQLLSGLRKPVVSTLHTLLREPSPEQRTVLTRVCQRSALCVVMSEGAKLWLHELYDVPLERIRLIPHGTPDVPFAPTAPAKARLGFGGRPTILTFGLLHPNKGIETVLDALVRVVPDFPDLLYVVLGVTHPAVLRRSGERYRETLRVRAAALGLADNVRFHDHFVSAAELREHLMAADVYLTPYRAREQIVSGTLAHALATGRAIVSTPYWYAQELLAEDRGLLFDFGDIDMLAVHLRALLGDDALREAIRRAAYAHGRSMTWPEAGHRYAELFQGARRSHRGYAVACDAEEPA